MHMSSHHHHNKHYLVQLTKTDATSRSLTLALAPDKTESISSSTPLTSLSSFHPLLCPHHQCHRLVGLQADVRHGHSFFKFLLFLSLTVITRCSRSQKSVSHQAALFHKVMLTTAADSSYRCSRTCVSPTLHLLQLNRSCNRDIDSRIVL